ncbi:MAG: hypothetical protein IKL36_06955 [Clostridia bacterium]|nr:hypothetical protein [Clostridia bacterium]
MKLFNRIMRGIINSLAVVCVFFIIYGLVFKLDHIRTNEIYVMTAIAVIGPIFEGFLLGVIKGDSQLIKWIRRGILFIVLIPSFILLLWYLNCFTAEVIIMAIKNGIIPALTMAVIVYIIDDIIERKRLKKINKKLSENVEDTNSGDYTIS